MSDKFVLMQTLLWVEKTDTSVIYRSDLNPPKFKPGTSEADTYPICSYSYISENYMKFQFTIDSVIRRY